MENQEELMYELSMFEQQIRQLQQQLQAVSQAILEIGKLNLGLSDVVGSKDKEILAPLGKGIFAKAKLISEDLIVDIGDGNLVKKSVPDTKKIIEKQIKKLEEVQKELEENIEKINQEVAKKISSIPRK
jgi:prefoldin alpha subunit